nr:putative ribonuclease h protein [Quercus suber]
MKQTTGLHSSNFQENVHHVGLLAHVYSGLVVWILSLPAELWQGRNGFVGRRYTTIYGGMALQLKLELIMCGRISVSLAMFCLSKVPGIFLCIRRNIQDLCIKKSDEFFAIVGDKPNKNPRTNIQVKWTKPLVGWLKLNTDGSALGNPGIAGGGGLIRNENGVDSVPYGPEWLVFFFPEPKPGTEVVEGIMLNIPIQKVEHLNVEAFLKMKNLRLLKIVIEKLPEDFINGTVQLPKDLNRGRVQLPQGLNYISNELRLLEWDAIRSIFIHISQFLEVKFRNGTGTKIVILPLSEEFGKIESYHLWLEYIHSRHLGSDWEENLNRVGANGFTQIEVTFESKGPGLEVTKCGAHVVYEQDIEDLKQTMAGAGSSSCIITPYYEDESDDEPEPPHPKAHRHGSSMPVMFGFARISFLTIKAGELIVGYVVLYICFLNAPVGAMPQKNLCLSCPCGGSGLTDLGYMRYTYELQCFIKASRYESGEVDLLYPRNLIEATLQTFGPGLEVTKCSAHLEKTPPLSKGMMTKMGMGLDLVQKAPLMIIIFIEDSIAKLAKLDSAEVWVSLYLHSPKRADGVEVIAVTAGKVIGSIRGLNCKRLVRIGGAEARTPSCIQRRCTTDLANSIHLQSH